MDKRVGGWVVLLGRPQPRPRFEEHDDDDSIDKVNMCSNSASLPSHRKRKKQRKRKDFEGRTESSYLSDTVFGAE